MKSPEEIAEELLKYHDKVHSLAHDLKVGDCGYCKSSLAKALKEAKLEGARFCAGVVDKSVKEKTCKLDHNDNVICSAFALEKGKNNCPDAFGVHIHNDARRDAITSANAYVKSLKEKV